MTYLDKVKTNVEREKSKKSKTNKKIGTEKGGQRIQDNIDLTPLSMKSFDCTNYASAHCRHQCLLRTSPGFTKINEFNENFKIEYRAALSSRKKFF